MKKVKKKKRKIKHKDNIDLTRIGDVEVEFFKTDQHEQRNKIQIRNGAESSDGWRRVQNR